MNPELIAKLVNVFEHGFALVSNLGGTLVKLEGDTTLQSRLDDALEVVKDVYNAIDNKGTVNETPAPTTTQPAATTDPSLGGTGEQGQQ